MDLNKNTLAYFESKETESPKFEFFIEKAQIAKSDSETTDMVIEGVASTTNVDHDHERMSESALKGMANIINEKGVPLRVEHSKDENAIIGQVFQAAIDDRGKLTIKAKLDKDHSTAKMLYEGLKTGAKLGLSVGGRVKSAVRELAEGLGKYVKTFYDVILDEVSVTPRPANFDAWLFNKSIASENEDTSRFYSTPLYDRFLFENQQLDYIYAIEKSIPSQAWVKVDKTQESKDMKKVFIKDIATEEDAVEETKSIEEAKKDGEEVVPPTETTVEGQPQGENVEENQQAAKDGDETEEVGEIVASKSYVDAKFNTVISLLKEIRKDMTTDATPADQSEANGTEGAAREEKEEDDLPTASESNKTNKEGEAADETTDGQITGAKPVEEGQEAAKAEDDEEIESEEKAEEDEKPETEKETEYGDDYMLEPVQRSRQLLTKAIKSGANPIDVLAAYASKLADDMNANFAKSGKRVLGLESTIADAIRNNVEIQKQLKEWMSTPGQKRSVSLGSPYMVTKEGGRFRLIAEDASVEKSVKKAAGDFKSVYTQNFSSTATGEQIA